MSVLIRIGVRREIVEVLVERPRQRELVLDAVQPGHDNGAEGEVASPSRASAFTSRSRRSPTSTDSKATPNHRDVVASQDAVASPLGRLLSTFSTALFAVEGKRGGLRRWLFAFNKTILERRSSATRLAPDTGHDVDESLTCRVNAVAQHAVRSVVFSVGDPVSWPACPPPPEISGTRAIGGHA
jgi:hypothetical protein